MATAHNHEAEQNFLVFGSVNLFRYTNHRGETAMRKIIPHCLRYGTSPDHKEEQWFIEGFDVDKQALRTYALRDILPR